MDPADRKASREIPALKVRPWSVPLVPLDALVRQASKAWPERPVPGELQRPDPKARQEDLVRRAHRAWLEVQAHKAEFRPV